MMMINADAKITALLYDDEHEETKRVEMTIADFLDSHTEEGCPQSGGWISAKDRLPEEHECRSEHRYDVMIWMMSDYVLVAHAGTVKIGYTESGVWYDDGGDPAIVDYWMQLPEAPKEEQNG